VKKIVLNKRRKPWVSQSVYPYHDFCIDVWLRDVAEEMCCVRQKVRSESELPIRISLSDDASKMKIHLYTKLSIVLALKEKVIEYKLL